MPPKSEKSAADTDGDKDEKPAAPATAEPERLKGVSVGRIVHYVPGSDGRFVAAPGAEHIAAIITRVCNAEAGHVNLRLFCDGATHNPYGNSEWVTDVLHAPADAPAEQATGHTWHFPEYVP